MSEASISLMGEPYERSVDSLPPPSEAEDWDPSHPRPELFKNGFTVETRPLTPPPPIPRTVEQLQERQHQLNDRVDDPALPYSSRAELEHDELTDIDFDNFVNSSPTPHTPEPAIDQDRYPPQTDSFDPSYSVLEAPEPQRYEETQNGASAQADNGDAPTVGSAQNSISRGASGSRSVATNPLPATAGHGAPRQARTATVKRFPCAICKAAGKVSEFYYVRDLIEHLTHPHRMKKEHVRLADPEGEKDWRGLCMRCLCIFQNSERLDEHCKEHRKKRQNEHKGKKWSRRKFDAINSVLAERWRVEDIIGHYSFIELDSPECKSPTSLRASAKGNPKLTIEKGAAQPPSHQSLSAIPSVSSSSSRGWNGRSISGSSAKSYQEACTGPTSPSNSDASTRPTFYSTVLCHRDKIPSGSSHPPPMTVMKRR